MQITIICPECHSKMIYQGGNVMVTLNADEVGKTQEVEATVCHKCGKVQAAFFFQLDLNTEQRQ